MSKCLTLASGVCDVSADYEDDYTSHEYWIESHDGIIVVGTAHTAVGLVTYLQLGERAAAFDSVEDAEDAVRALFPLVIEAEFADGPVPMRSCPFSH